MFRTRAPVPAFALCLLAGWIASGFFAPTAVSAATTILACDFDAEPLDQVIATGGAAAGQPVDLSDTGATVRATPLPSPSLEISDTWGFGARAVTFDFLDGVEITSGVLTVSMTLQFAQLEDFAIGLREHGSAAVPFLDILFRVTGAVGYFDLDTPPSLTQIGTYAAGTPYTLTVEIDLDARVYDVRLDSTLLRDDESLGSSSRGIGWLLTTMEHDVDSTGTFYVDDVVVTATTLPTPVQPTTWGALKEMWR
jgi:hypothetical protein